MVIKLGQSYSFHQIGQRGNQEDSRFPDSDTPDINQRFFLVCDGVGGSEKGEVASQTVCKAFGKVLAKFAVEKNDFKNQDFSHALDYAYNAPDELANASNEGMATTMTFAAFHRKGCTLAHIGDSRIYQIRPSKGLLIYRSDDHSLVNSLVHANLITPEEALTHPQRNVITRFMGPVDGDQPRCMATVMRSTDIASGDYFFLCSDGVLSEILDDQLLELFCNTDLSDEEKIKKIAKASENSHDNNTAMLIHVEDVTLEDNELSSEDDTEIDEKENEEVAVDEAAEEHDTLQSKSSHYHLEDIESIPHKQEEKGFKSFLKNLFHK